MTLNLVGKVEDLVIPSGSNTSNVIKSKSGHNQNIMLYGINTTDGAITYTIEVSSNGTDWVTLTDSANNNIVPPLTGKAKQLSESAVQLRIKSSANVTANRTWHVSAEI